MNRQSPSGANFPFWFLLVSRDWFGRINVWSRVDLRVCSEPQSFLGCRPGRPRSSLRQDSSFILASEVPDGCQGPRTNQNPPSFLVVPHIL